MRSLYFLFLLLGIAIAPIVDARGFSKDELNSIFENNLYTVGRLRACSKLTTANHLRRATSLFLRAAGITNTDELMVTFDMKADMVQDLFRGSAVESKDCAFVEKMGATELDTTMAGLNRVLNE